MSSRKKKGVVARLEWYREALDQTRRLFPELRLTPLVFFDSWTDVSVTLLTEGAMEGPVDRAKPPALFEAAEFFGLHLGNEAEEALLLHILADVVFGGTKSGRPRARPSADKSKMEVLKRTFSPSKNWHWLR